MAPKPELIPANLQTSGTHTPAPAAAPAPATFDYFRTKWDNFDDNSSDEEEVKSKPRPPAPDPKKTTEQQKAIPTPTAPPGFASVAKGPAGKVPAGSQASMAARLADTMDLVRGEEGPTAASEKDKGNDHFRKGEWESAVACYSCSLALRPTAVAHANRAMALIKLKRLEEAESDCSSAIDLDDAYVKAYSRRGSARLGMKKYKEAVQDPAVMLTSAADFIIGCPDFSAALCLDAGNNEIQHQLATAQKLAGTKVPPVTPGPESTTPPSRKLPPVGTAAVPSIATPPVTAATSAPLRVPAGRIFSPQASDPLPGGADRNHEEPGVPPGPVSVPAGATSAVRPPPAGATEAEEEREGSASCTPQGAELMPGGIQIGAYSRPSPTPEGGGGGWGGEAARAAVAKAQLMMGGRRGGEVKSWSQLERGWKEMGGDGEAKANILKALDPVTLPALVGDQLTAPFLSDMLQVILDKLWACDSGLSIALLQTLTLVPRFLLNTMCLTTNQRQGLQQRWTKAVEFATMWEEEERRSHGKQLEALRSKYRL